MLAGAACGGSAAAQSDPGAQQPPTPVAACRAADLKALFRGFNVAGGSLTAAVVVIDAGARPCLLDGTPQSVTLLDESGDTVTVKSRALALPADAGPVELTPGAAMPAFGAPPAHGSAWFVVTWSNWCSDAVPAVTSLLVVLPAGGSVSAPGDTTAPNLAGGPRAPRCDDQRAGSTVTISRFQAPLTPGS